MRYSTCLAVLFTIINTPLHAQFLPPVNAETSVTLRPAPFSERFSASPSSPESDTSLSARLQFALDSTYDLTPSYDKHGVAASVIVPGYPQWTGAAGTSDDSNPMSPDLSFEIGSVTKTFITALILQLRDEGKLSLTDSISKYLPSYPNVDSTITIEQLLDHSSGVYDYLNDDPATRLLDSAYSYNPGKHWTAAEILENFVGPPNFKPGHGYRYSNTDFLLLGQIADSITKQPASVEIHRRFLTPLGLTHTLCSWYDSIPTNFPHNYSNYDPRINGSVDYYSINKTAQLSMANTAGGMVSIPAELARWSQALYTGQLLGNTTTAQMLNINSFHKMTDGIYYNLGTMLIGTSYDYQYVFGHAGSMIGFITIMATIPHDSVTVVVYVNSLTDTIIASNYLVSLLYQIENPPKSGVAAGPSEAQGVKVYPNPVRGRTSISFDQNTPGESVLTLYNELGNEVRSVADAANAPGPHQIVLESAGLADGAYYYRLQMPTFTKTGVLLVAQ